MTGPTPRPAVRLDLTPVDPLDPHIAELDAEVQAEYVLRYGGPDGTPMDAGQFRPPDGGYLLGTVGGEVAGCGGFRRHDTTAAEVKRMFVRAPWRRRGLARQLLAGLERAALAAGYERLVLETGTAQPEAIALYETSGYERVEPFGFYRDSPSSRYFATDLRGAPGR